MLENVNMMETILENEAKLFLKLVSELENDDLYDFIRQVARVEPRAGHSATEDILRVAQNVKGIEAAIENFYRV